MSVTSWFTNTYPKIIISVNSFLLGIKSQKTFIKSKLCLASQVFMNTSKDDYHFKSSIGSFTNYTYIICSFTRLNLPNDHSSFVYLYFLCWFKKCVKCPVCKFFNGLNSFRRELFLFFQIPFIPVPESPFNF